MVKCVKQFSGYYGCDRCTQRGSWEGRMTYPEVDNLNLRTDQSFRECWQPEHHQEEKISPFSVLPVDMVKSFPIDYMHQSCLGVMKKLLLMWTRGKTEYRMSSGDVACVSERLEALRKFIPDCFARKARGLQEIERWKATEFRQFALYTGKIVLKGALQGHLYEHFLCFSTALCILVSPELTKSQGLYASQLLKYFVEKGRELYGETFLVYNVHSLLHLSEDAQNFGCLDNCSAFKFESCPHQMKKMVCSGKNVLTQVANRLEETSKLKMANEETVASFKGPNNVFVLSPEECCEVVSEEVENTVMCRVFTNLQPFLMMPCDSRLYGTYVASIRHSKMRCLHRKALAKKAIMVEEHGGVRIVMSILHTL
ncbi:transposase domain-containing protein [Labeo rohita]|uniref:Transposase domain-containing protein n=1 Tax=Labeo rohita TaxID=84645 RepID=A0A498NXW4_LABRO|nr:transposase domain-containing protein [Labeo rohita]